MDAPRMPSNMVNRARFVVMECYGLHAAVLCSTHYCGFARPVLRGSDECLRWPLPMPMHAHYACAFLTSIGGLPLV